MTAAAIYGYNVAWIRQRLPPANIVRNVNGADSSALHVGDRGAEAPARATGRCRRDLRTPGAAEHANAYGGQVIRQNAVRADAQ